MLVIRRLVDRHQAYTGIFLPGEPAKIFPTTDFEHGRILQIYKQDKAYEGVVNDFSDEASIPLKNKPSSPSSETTVKAKRGKKRGITSSRPRGPRAL